jgi:hypothetical protein
MAGGDVRYCAKALPIDLARLVLMICASGEHPVREEHMQKIESFAFSVGLIMAGLLVLATVAPVPAAVELRQDGGGIIGLASPRAA